MRFSAISLLAIGVHMCLSVCHAKGQSAEVIEVEKGEKEGVRVSVDSEEKRAKQSEKDSLALNNEGVLFTEAKVSESEAEELSKLSVPVRVIKDKEIAEKHDAPYPGLYYENEGKIHKHALSGASGEALLAEVKQKIAQDKIPLFQEITEKNYKDYDETGLPTAYLVSSVREIESFRWIEACSSKFAGKLNIALLDYDKTEFFLKNAGVTKDMAPCLFLIREAEGGVEKYVRSVKDAEQAEKFLGEFLSGTADPYLMSEEVPKEAEKENVSGVRKIVMKNFKEMAMDPLKDVLVVFHVNWCRFCREFLPELNKIAELLKKEKIEDVVIGEMLMSSNDLPLDVETETIRAYPTIRLYKKGTNREVEHLNQDRPANALTVLEFLKKETEIPQALSFAEAPKKSAEEGARVDL